MHMHSILVQPLIAISSPIVLADILIIVGVLALSVKFTIPFPHSIKGIVFYIQVGVIRPIDPFLYYHNDNYRQSIL